MAASPLFCFGLGYSALALARRLAASGWVVAGTCRSVEKGDVLAAAGGHAHLFGRAQPLTRGTLRGSTPLLLSGPPGPRGAPRPPTPGGDLAAVPGPPPPGPSTTAAV